MTPEGYDRGMRLAEKVPLSSLRRQLFNGVAGDVLEIGMGTGANLGFYGPNVNLTAIDLRETFLQTSIGKAAVRGPASLSASVANGQQLPFASDAFDMVVGTLVFCSISAPYEALSEICRVLRPNGSLLLLEHVHGQKPLARVFTTVAHPVWFAIQGECHLNRETAVTVANAGFTINQVTNHSGGLLQIIRASAPSTCL